MKLAHLTFINTTRPSTTQDMNFVLKQCMSIIIDHSKVYNYFCKHANVIIPKPTNS